MKALGSLGYTILRQRGSHVQLSKNTPAGEHRITIPLHDEIAKGTLNDIVTKVSQWNCITKEDFFDLLR
ncbi:MAG: type II toxin-antitoxin system HicA family toxin [Methanofollis sp.]|uniref:type II toxin-antitoxin system HicA family toxin n=1 Tax=Methanofollis sp. TaxID=2052835 RepID=UPI002614A53D|nr:type II toxin-antitoxin system HicA family toxin [Methanofollis sp.]MDD4255213.1 type II toxin-antitoxin system HicA family toxin [Methanofollis sp.]